MAGELVPLVLIPRYTTLAGDSTFTTVAIDVTAFEKAIANTWRGKASAAGFSIKFEESTDQESWTTCTNGTGGDPGSETEAQYTPTLTKRWFRASVTLTGTDPVITCWCLGFLELRQS